MLENIPLAPLTTLGIGGPARWLAEAASEEEIAQASEWARERGIPLFVLGGGSNVLIADAGFAGLVLHVAVKGMERDGGLFRVGAGEDWDGFVEHAVTSDCAGVECLAGIPGTVGGTPVQNVGAYGQEVASVIERARAFDLKSRTFVEFSAAECEFGYRRSRFNTRERGRYIVTRVDYRLTRGGAPTLEYAELEGAVLRGKTVGDVPSLKEVSDAVRQIRRSKGMLIVEGDPDCRSAGSFFKNPVVSIEHYQRISEPIAGVPGFPVRDDSGKVQAFKMSAAWLIEHAGFQKGFALGAAGISTKHTLAIVNRGGATAREILALAEKIRSAVEERFGIRLEMEPELVGF